MHGDQGRIRGDRRERRQWPCERELQLAPCDLRLRRGRQQDRQDADHTHDASRRRSRSRHRCPRRRRARCVASVVRCERWPRGANAGRRASEHRGRRGARLGRDVCARRGVRAHRRARAAGVRRGARVRRRSHRERPDQARGARPCRLVSRDERALDEHLAPPRARLRHSREPGVDAVAIAHASRAGALPKSDDDRRGERIESAHRVRRQSSLREVGGRRGLRLQVLVALARHVSSDGPCRRGHASQSAAPHASRGLRDLDGRRRRRVVRDAPPRQVRRHRSHGRSQRLGVAPLVHRELQRRRLLHREEPRLHSPQAEPLPHRWAVRAHAGLQSLVVREGRRQRRGLRSAGVLAALLGSRHNARRSQRTERRPQARVLSRGSQGNGQVGHR